MLSRTRGGEAERGNKPHCPEVVVVGVLLKVDPMESVDMRRYSCLSYRAFQA